MTGTLPAPTTDGHAGHRPPPSPTTNDHPLRKMSMREIFNLMALQLPQYQKCFAMLARWRDVRGHENIGDQVSAIWRQHGFYSFTITQDDARAIWRKIPGSSEKSMTEHEISGSLPIGSFVERALTLSKEQ